MLITSLRELACIISFCSFQARLTILAQGNKIRGAGTLAASVNHSEGLKLHLRLHPSRSLPRVAHRAADSSGGLFVKIRKQVGS